MQNVKTHIIALELILPAATDFILTMIEEAAVQELPLSSNTLCKKMEKISDDINDQLVAKMHENDFSLQLDEATTSISNKTACLICYIRFMDNNGSIIKDLLFCKPILTNC